MPLFTPEQLQKVREIVTRYHQAAAVNIYGPEAVAPEVLETLRASGLVHADAQVVHDAFAFGQFAQAFGVKQAQALTGKEVLGELKKRPPTPLTPGEREVVSTAARHAGQYVVGHGDRISARIGGIIGALEASIPITEVEAIVADKTAANRAKRETIKQLKSDLGHEIPNWMRDWERIAVTEISSAVQMGTATAIRKESGGDALVSKIPRPDACPDCLKHYLGPDGLPIIAPLSWWEAQGSNVGRKRAEWGAVLETMHPWCSCQVVEVPEGTVWVDGPDGFELVVPDAEVSLMLSEDPDVSDGVSELEARRLAERLRVDLKAIKLEEWRRGIEHEREHSDVVGNDPVKTARIALAHLREDPLYYTGLARMERRAKVRKSESVASWIEVGEDFAKGLTRGGKYVRRVPYTDSKGKRKYRYYYRESAAARSARAGEQVRFGSTVVTVVEVRKDGSVILEDGGGRRQVGPDMWHAMLTSHYGDAFVKSAERRSAQALNAVTRHVPKALLEDLKGATDEERLKDLERRVPEVYRRLEKAFGRAGMTSFEAKSTLSRVLSRRGWEPEARAVVIGGAIRHRGVKVGELIRAAEGLAGGTKVQQGHAAAAVELRAPKGKPASFAATVLATATQAERELIKLQKMIQEAKAGDRDGAEVLAAGLAAEAIQRLQLLAQAFPGIQDRAVEPTREALVEAGNLAPAPATKTDGAAAVVYVAGEGGKASALKGRYRLMEAGDVVASHDPDSFRPHEDYPEGVQERAYHRDKAEQAKVLRNAKGLKPAFVVNTNPDATNGPPVVTGDGVVLGGNSRAMSMQRVYSSHPERAAELRAYLEEHAHEMGLTPEDVKAMKEPVLVREVELPDTSKVGLQIAVRQMNENFTQGMDPRTMQVAQGRRLSDATLKALGDAIGEDETLAAFLASPRSDRFVQALFRDGVIDQRNFNQYTVKGTRRLNSDGVTLVSRILVGRHLQDADLLSATTPQLVESLAQSVPAMMQAEAYGDGYAIGDDLRVAVSAFNELQHRATTGAIPALDSKMSAASFQRLFGNFDVLPGIGEPHPVLENPRARLLLEVLVRRRGPVQMAKVFRSYAKRASKSPEGQAAMFGAPASPHEVLVDTLKESMGAETLAGSVGMAHVVAPSGGGSSAKPTLLLSIRARPDLVKAGGPYIGPRGGKWSDVKHTIPWKERKVKKAKRVAWSLPDSVQSVFESEVLDIAADPGAFGVEGEEASAYRTLAAHYDGKAGKLRIPTTLEAARVLSNLVIDLSNGEDDRSRGKDTDPDLKPMHRSARDSLSTLSTRLTAVEYRLREEERKRKAAVPKKLVVIQPGEPRGRPSQLGLFSTKEIVASDPALTPEQKVAKKSEALTVIQTAIAKDAASDPTQWELPAGARVDDPWDPEPADESRQWGHPDLGEGAGVAPWDDSDWHPDLHSYDYIVINSSGGKDSQAQLTAVIELADAQGYPRDKIVVVHADLGRAEWEGTKSLAQLQADHYGVSFEVVQREQNDLIDQIDERHGDLAQKDTDVAALAEAGIRTWSQLQAADPEDVLAIIGEGKGTSKWPGEHRSKDLVKKAVKKAAKIEEKHQKALAKAKDTVDKAMIKLTAAKTDPKAQKADRKLKAAKDVLAELEAVQDVAEQPVDFGKAIAWPSSDARYCTSDHKRVEVQKLHTRLSKEHKGEGRTPPAKILNALGIRAQESTSRARMESFSREKATSAQVVDRWYPIHQWAEERVWETIRESGLPHHKAYDLGMRRLSCVFCVFATKEDLMVAAKHNPDLFKTYLELEERVGSSFQPTSSLADVEKEIARRRSEGYELDELAKWVKKATGLTDIDLVKADLQQPSLINLILEAAWIRLSKRGFTPTALTMEWKVGGLCVHLDDSRDSQHIEYVPYPQAYNASMVAATFAQRHGLTVEEHNAPAPREGGTLYGVGARHNPRHISTGSVVKGSPDPAHKPIARIRAFGFDIALEHHPGDRRTWADGESGAMGVTQMQAGYGYFVGTKGADGDPVDCYLGPDSSSKVAVVIHQQSAIPGGGYQFDEDKVMLGYSGEEEAVQAYLAHMDTEDFLETADELSLIQLRTYLKKPRMQKALMLLIQNPPRPVTTVLGNQGVDMVEAPPRERVSRTQGAELSGLVPPYGAEGGGDNSGRTAADGRMSRTRRGDPGDWGLTPVRRSSQEHRTARDWTPEMLEEIREENARTVERAMARLERLVAGRRGGLRLDVAEGLLDHARRGHS